MFALRGRVSSLEQMEDPCIRGLRFSSVKNCGLHMPGVGVVVVVVVVGG